MTSLKIAQSNGVLEVEHDEAGTFLDRAVRGHTFLRTIKIAGLDEDLKVRVLSPSEELECSYEAQRSVRKQGLPVDDSTLEIRNHEYWSRILYRAYCTSDSTPDCLKPLALSYDDFVSSPWLSGSVFKMLLENYLDTQDMYSLDPERMPERRQIELFEELKKNLTPISLAKLERSLLETFTIFLADQLLSATGSK
jgi:hypothetical protein